MTDYFCPPPPIKARHRPSHSTSGDTNIPQQQWIWSLHSISNTPSQKLGMTSQTESYQRSRAVHWMVQAAISLALPQIIIATAATYLHRFYMRKSMQKYPIKEISATAFFLATKVEEVPRKLEYVVKEYLKLDPTSHLENSNGMEDPKEFELLKQHILYYEDILLRTLCFDLAIDHPYLPLIHACKHFHLTCAQASTGAPTSSIPSTLIDFSNSMKARSIAQSAWSFVNDSLMTTLCVTTHPSVVAAAAFLIAISHRVIEGASLESDPNHEPNSIDQNDPSTQSILLVGDIDRLVRPSTSDSAYQHEPWWKSFGAQSLAEVHDAANTILEQYNDSVAPRVLQQVRKVCLPCETHHSSASTDFSALSRILYLCVTSDPKSYSIFWLLTHLMSYAWIEF
ncbi:cyclin-like protein [Melampsora americana]|nr:cyclin-like protein [Melampsora americana]